MRPISQLTREQKLLGNLNLAITRGIEVGALNAPIARRPAANIRYVDHADQQTLRAKYAGDPNVNPDDLVPVDAIWGERTLAECFPGDHFDYLIASHVLEHVPNLIGWLEEVAEILHVGASLVLAIPDRRYTFDLLRRETSLAEAIGHYLTGITRPSPGQVFDSQSNVVDFDHMKAWFGASNTTPSHFVDHAYALNHARKSAAGEYVDCHCSVFTARSLLGMLDGLLALDLLPFALHRFHVAEVGSAEMSLILTRTDAGTDRQQARATIQAMLASGQDSEGLTLDSDRTSEEPDLSEKVRQLQQALTCMQQSTSWSMTAPLRRIAARVKTRRIQRHP